MASIFIDYLPPSHPQDGVLTELAALDRFGVHNVVANPKHADIVLLVKLSGHGPFLHVLRNPLYRAFSERTFLFCSGDKPLIYFSLLLEMLPITLVGSASFESSILMVKLSTRTAFLTKLN